MLDALMAEDWVVCRAVSGAYRLGGDLSGPFVVSEEGLPVAEKVVYTNCSRLDCRSIGRG